MKQKLNKLEKYWVMYDVGNSAFALLVSTIIPIYFKNMAAGNGISASDSTAYLSYAISISTLIVAVLGPVLPFFPILWHPAPDFFSDRHGIPPSPP